MTRQGKQDSGKQDSGKQGSGQGGTVNRRGLLKTIGAGTIAGAGAVAIGAPFISDPARAATTTWKVQTSWPAGVGLETFKALANRSAALRVGKECVSTFNSRWDPIH